MMKLNEIAKLRKYIIENYDRKFNELNPKITSERSLLFSIFPLATLETMKLQEYDKIGNKQTFMNIIERHTKAFGSGHLAFNSNKLFYHSKIDGEYHVSKFIERKYSSYNEIEEKFEQYIADVKNFIINIDLENYNSSAFLEGSNILKIKFILLYREDIRLSCITSVNPCKKIIKHFGIICNDNVDDSITYNYEITKFLDSLDESFKNKNILVLSFLLWDFYKANIDKNVEKKVESEIENDIEPDDMDYDEENFTDYTIDDFIKDVYISDDDAVDLLELLKYKKNIILQGPPGTGKTFMAKKLAYALMDKDSEEYIKFIQFHQSYSYEDFVLGYKPVGQGFKLVDGVFYEFCLKASSQENKEHKFVFIIDEINRGNISKIFGELLMLIEKEYRGPKHKLQLTYEQREFYIPENLYIIGMMNTADRSLAVLDYALKRRFGFYDVRPAYKNDKFVKYIKSKNSPKLEKIIDTIIEINEDIANDPSLGEGFEIGHSYFCNLDTVDDKLLYRIISFEILPLLNEYWYDDKSKYNKYKNVLLGIINE